MYDLFSLNTSVLRLKLQAPFLVSESTPSFTVSVIADRDVGTPLTLYVFTVSNKTVDVAQGRINIPSFVRDLVIPLNYDLTEVEDYVAFNYTVILMPGQPLTTDLTAMLVNDNRLEQPFEIYEIRMELAEPPLAGTVNLVGDQADVAIQDDDGWLM